MKRFLRPIYYRFKRIGWWFARTIPWTRMFYETRETQTPITFSMWFWQKILGFNRDAYWPTHFTSKVLGARNIYAGVETCPGYSPGCYIQGLGKIFIGDYTQIAANVGIISANHDVYDNRHHPSPQAVRIGRYCWVGMNATILPGVVLGDFTVVGAGAVVTKSFPEGYSVIAGNPAKVIRLLDPESCIEHHSEHEYFGYLPARKFAAFRQRHLNV